jgi:hypothetical protein
MNKVRLHCGDHKGFTASEISRLIGINALSVKAWYRLKYKEWCYTGVCFGAPYVSAFHSYPSPVPLSRTGQSRVPPGTEILVTLCVCVYFVRIPL